MRKYILLLSVLFLLGCDFKMKINQEKKITVDTDCGKIEITCKNFQYVRYHLKLKVIEGEYEINTEKFKILADTTYGEPTLDWFCNDEKISGIIQLKKGENFRCYIYLSKEDLTQNSLENEMKVIANGFVVCNGKSLINDTIRVTR